MMRIGMICLLAVGCATRPSVPPSSGLTAETPVPVEDVVPAPPSRLLTPDGAFDCSANWTQTRVCDGEEGCIQVHGDGCRMAANACEEVIPVTRLYSHIAAQTGSTAWPQGESLTFQQGDPCASVDAECAYGMMEGVCEPFISIPECPETAEHAADMQISCMHPEQPALVCLYPGIRYECGVPWRPTSGVRQVPGTHDKPSHWFATPDYDYQGCPATPLARNAACDPLPIGDCVIYDVRYSCPNGVWESEALPPRP